MPLADYFCTQCGHVARDVSFRMAIGAIASAPSCPHCEETRLEVIPQIGAMDASSGPGFRRFTINRDGQRVVIDSLSTLRAVERDSEQRYRNGEGEPLRFRMWNQDRSNRDVGSFGTAGQIGARTYGSGEAPVKGGRVSITRHGEDAPDVPLGPGMPPGGYTPL